MKICAILYYTLERWAASHGCSQSFFIMCTIIRVCWSYIYLLYTHQEIFLGVSVFPKDTWTCTSHLLQLLSYSLIHRTTLLDKLKLHNTGIIVISIQCAVWLTGLITLHTLNIHTLWWGQCSLIIYLYTIKATQYIISNAPKRKCHLGFKRLLVSLLHIFWVFCFYLHATIMNKGLFCWVVSLLCGQALVPLWPGQ